MQKYIFDYKKNHCATKHLNNKMYALDKVAIILIILEIYFTFSSISTLNKKFKNIFYNRFPKEVKNDPLLYL